ncbi:uncharacterized protein LOC123882501 [Trifolium pratense]|uniref:uncharacterized protein LOC123882501 n=1 Tax=Trifolium pratense TaxID=57577 RepID=UPI001E696457|nr:uncharacterized protein LOC123882501 [Trifolium pratense]
MASSPALCYLTPKDTYPKEPSQIRVKNKTPAPIQITAKLILAEARVQEDSVFRPPIDKISDQIELNNIVNDVSTITTPKGQKSVIQEISTCPQAPKKSKKRNMEMDYVKVIDDDDDFYNTNRSKISAIRRNFNMPTSNTKVLRESTFKFLNLVDQIELDKIVDDVSSITINNVCSTPKGQESVIQEQRVVSKKRNLELDMDSVKDTDDDVYDTNRSKISAIRKNFNMSTSNKVRESTFRFTGFI